MNPITTVLCCDGPYNGEYYKPVSLQVGVQFHVPNHNGHYECVEWADTDEIVAYWRSSELDDLCGAVAPGALTQFDNGPMTCGLPAGHTGHHKLVGDF